MSGNGNDFILIDNRSNEFSHLVNSEFVRKISARGMSVGADGVIFIENSDIADFKWKFFNSDGTIAEMCGNGAKCAVKYAYINNIVEKNMNFETDAGVIEGYIINNEDVKVLLTTPYDKSLDNTIILKDKCISISSINTGVPHGVIFVQDIKNTNVKSIGKEIRYHNNYLPNGTNVNFVKVVDSNTIKVRTYERGVEGETLACGTGAVASALISIDKDFVSSPVKVITASNKILIAYIEKSKVYLQGSARLVYSGTLNKEGYNY